jgi:UDP-glucose 4-epimerase
MGDAGRSHALVTGESGFIGTGSPACGDSCQLRDLAHADDIAAGIFTAWRSGFTGPLILGAGEGELAAAIADISAAQAVGYEPTHDLESGLVTVWPESAGAEKAQ